MKRKALVIIATIMIVLGTIFIVNSTYTKVKAAPGFDASYDSGGSSFDSASSFDSGPSSDGSGTPIELNTFGKIMMFVILPIGIILAIYGLISGKKRIEIGISRTSITDVKFKKASKEKIQTLLGRNFNIEEFNKELFNIYYDVCISWSNNDIDSAKHLLSNEIYNMYRTQIATMVFKKQRNVMEEIEYVDSYISSIEKYSSYTEIKCILHVTCRDYIIDINTNKVLRGDKKVINEYIYEITLVCDNIKNKKINNCPNCGAKLDDKTSTTCPYCRSRIVKPSNKYVMTQKKMLVQGRK